MPILVLARKEFAPGTFFGLLTLAMVWAMIAASVGVMFQHPSLPAFQSSVSSLLTGESRLPRVAPIPLVSSAADPGLARLPLAANTLLQFTSEGHVLGFGERGIFIARGDHALRVEFVGSRAAFPQVQGRREISAASLQGGRPLAEVTYADVWEGVHVV